MVECPVCFKAYPLNEIEMHVELCLTKSSNDGVAQPGNIRHSNPQLHASKWTDPNPYQLDTDDGLDQDYQHLLSSINNIYGKKEASKPNPQPALPAEEIANQKIEFIAAVIPKANLPNEVDAFQDHESYYELELRSSFVQEMLDLVRDDQRATASEQVAKHLKHAWACRCNKTEWHAEGMSEAAVNLVRKYVTTRSDWQEAMERLGAVQLSNKNIGMFSVLPQELVFIIFNSTSAFINCKLAQCSKDMTEVSESDVIWREQFAKDFKSTKKLKDDKTWKQNYRDAFQVEMNGAVLVSSLRPVKWAYSHTTKTLVKNVPGGLPQKFALKENRITGGAGQYYWAGNTLRGFGIHQGTVTFSHDSKSFQCFVNGVFCFFNTRVVKEFPAEWQITKLSGGFLRMSVTGFIPIPLLAFICYATLLEN